MLNLPEYKRAERVFHYFEEISRIPHGSGNTKEIADYLVSFAREHSLEVIRDDAQNVLIRKPATRGHEDRPAVIIQGHTDMVAVKAPDSDKDLERDGIDVYVDGDYLRARGTSLGGDDGIAVAYALALLESTDIPHPPIEALFTSDEEIGLLGAAAFDKSLLKGRILLNIDSDDEGVFTVGCAGGVRTDSVLKLSREPYEGKRYTLKISGLLGGHSGVEIDRGRANGIKVGFRIIEAIDGARIISAEGGLADNAIPRELTLTFATCDPQCAAKVRELSAVIAEEYKLTDPDLRAELSEYCGTEEPCDGDSSMKIIRLINAVPYGIIAMNPHIEGLVQTSINCGIVKVDEDTLRLCASVRSSVSAEKEALVARVRAAAQSVGATFTTRGDYPGWEYRENSYIRDLASRVYCDMYGKAPQVITIHAGLECGLFSDAIDDLDCISFGPDNKDIHTTEEHISISSCARVYDYILELLKKI